MCENVTNVMNVGECGSGRHNCSERCKFLKGGFDTPPQVLLLDLGGTLPPPLVPLNGSGGYLLSSTRLFEWREAWSSPRHDAMSTPFSCAVSPTSHEPAPALHRCTTLHCTEMTLKVELHMRHVHVKAPQ